MKVNIYIYIYIYIYIGFWTLKMKCTQYGLYGQLALKNARLRPRSRQAKVGGGGARLWPFRCYSCPPPWCVQLSLEVFRETPANNWCKGLGIGFDTLQPTHRTPSTTISSKVAPFVIIATIKRDPMDLQYHLLYTTKANASPIFLNNSKCESMYGLLPATRYLGPWFEWGLESIATPTTILGTCLKPHASYCYMFTSLMLLPWEFRICPYQCA
jgi:hypothetical protein